MKLADIHANRERNAKALRDWLDKHYIAKGKAVPGYFRGPRGHERIFYFLAKRPFHIGRVRFIPRLGSVELKQPSIFNDAGKLKVRLLRPPQYPKRKIK